MEYSFSTREKNGSICLILSYKVNSKWKQKTKQGFKTLREAKQYQDKLLAAAKEDAACGADPELADITFENFTRNIYLRDKKSSLEYSTLNNYFSMLLCIPALCSKPIRTITAGDVINVYQDMGRFSEGTRKNRFAQIRAIFNYAINPYKIITENPANSVTQTKDKTIRKIKALTEKESLQLLDALSATPTFYMIAFIALNTGMRYGEIAGLTWSSINFSRQTIAIDKQYNWISPQKRGFKAVKSRNGNRTIHMNTKLAAKLNEWKQTAPISIDGRIIPTTPSTHPLMNRQLRRLKQGISVHTLRHTFATMLLSKSKDINLVAAVLGDNVATVAATYIHYTDDIRKEADQYIETMYK